MFKKTSLILLFVVSIFIVSTKTASAAETIKVRLGWQIPWATQGQLVQVLKHTDILAKRGIKAEFIGRTYGPELNEAGLAGQLDVILTADQPAATLFAKSADWVIIGRLMYNRTTIYVPPSSPIKSVLDLKGKTIGVPIGAAAERILVASLRKAGLNPQQDVKIVNLGMLEHAPLIKRSDMNATKWGQFDALAGFDPIPAILEVNNLVRTISTGKVVSVVLMNRKFIDTNPGVAQKMIMSFADAYYYYGQNKNQADDWFLTEARLSDANHQACRLADSLEPNLKVGSYKDIRVTFTAEDIELMQQGADFMTEKTKRQVNMRDYIINNSH